MDEHWFPWIVAAAAGASAAAVGWVVAALLADVPDEDRTYRDRPPLAFRLAWWPIHWLSFYLGRVLPMAWRVRVHSRLRLAGLDYALTAEQFVSAQVASASFAGGVCAFVLDTWHVDQRWSLIAAATAFGFVFPQMWMRDRVQARKRSVLKALPFYLDIITLCVEAGLNLTGAFQQAVAKGEAGPLRDELARVLRDVRAGKARADALRTMADRMNEPAVTNLVSAVIQAENMGMNLGPILRAQAEQRRTERFARAEKLAMEAPVKMLFPLIAFIFPCTFLVLGFPIVMKFMRMGM
ncbi:MAG: type II secretion system F family protein [Pseudomonadota bacterium]